MEQPRKVHYCNRVTILVNFFTFINVSLQNGYKNTCAAKLWKHANTSGTLYNNNNNNNNNNRQSEICLTSFFVMLLFLLIVDEFSDDKFKTL